MWTPEVLSVRLRPRLHALALTNSSAHRLDQLSLEKQGSAQRLLTLKHCTVDSQSPGTEETQPLCLSLATGLTASLASKVSDEAFFHSVLTYLSGVQLTQAAALLATL